jgi:diguanylate cyclase (GGDEF)-like protein
VSGSKLLVTQTAIYAVTMAGLVTSAVAGAGSAEQIAGPAMLWYDIVAVVFGVRASRHPGADRLTRRFSRVVTAALVLTLGISLTFSVTGTRAFPQPGDALHIAAMLVLFAALMLAPLRAATRHERWKTLLDAGTVAVGASMLLWYLVIGPALENRQATVGLILAAACYPLVDLLVLFGLARALLRGTGQISRSVLWMLGGATVAILVGDVRLGYAQAHSAVVYRATFDFTVWLTTHLMLTCAAIELWRRAGRPVTAADTVRRGAAGKLPYLGVALGHGLLVTAALQESRVFPWAGLVLGGAAITGLVVLRQLVVQREITVAAETDALTGLANRPALHDELTRALHRSARTGRAVAVLLVDLDGFKRINDTLGHQVGDGLLVAVAAAIRGSVRDGDLVARLGGDEFAVLVRQAGGEPEAAAVAEAVSRAIAGPFVVAGRPMNASASIGVAVSEPGELSPDALLHRADMAMYDIKRQGGGQSWHPAGDLAPVAETLRRNDDGTGRYVVVRPAPQRLRSPRFVAEIGDVLATHGLAPHDLVVDVPDDAGREPDVAARLEALRAVGVRVAVHDFRIGYADFRTVPVDLLRIDVPREPCDVPVAEAVIRLGRALGLATLVGDVEVPADATDLRRLLRAGGQERLRG